MTSIKWRLAVALGLVELFTLAMALVLYVGAARLEQSAHDTSRANDEVREILSFALLSPPSSFIAAVSAPTPLS